MILTPGYRAELRFWQNVNKYGPNGCWNWLGCVQRGYGVVGAKTWGTSRAHRVSYELLVGPVPEDLQLDHLCRNRKCVNPTHLEPVTLHENNVVRGTGLAAENAKKTECPRGHEYSGLNSEGRRICKICQREALRRSRARRKA